jgi:ubiquinone/menaquinone biosynthesis C-methylase UbiE
MITRKSLIEMNYSEWVALIKERNRPSGGIKSVHAVAVNAFIDSSKKVLEIGCNTGFTSVNLSLLTGCRCIGIDINKTSIQEAKEYAKAQGVDRRVNFMVANALSLPFPDETFDVVWCSNVTSFIDKKQKAISEYLRVLKLEGTLVVIPIYYIKKPPSKILKEVSRAIGAEIKFWRRDDWINLFNKVALKNKCALELYYEKSYIYENRAKFIKKYVETVLNKKHLSHFNKDLKELIKKRTLEFFTLFNKNLQYAGYSILLFQKRKIKDEIELFITKEK